MDHQATLSSSEACREGIAWPTEAERAGISLNIIMSQVVGMARSSYDKGISTVSEAGSGSSGVGGVQDNAGSDTISRQPNNSKLPHSKLWGITEKGATPIQITDGTAFIPPAS